MSWFKPGDGSDARGYQYLNSPPIEGQDTFTNSDLTSCETDRDAYFTSNPDELAKYDADPQLIVSMVYGGSLLGQSRLNGSWVSHSPVSAIDLANHSVEELNDVISKGRGAIITEAEAQAISDAANRLAQLTNVDNTSDADKPVSTPQDNAFVRKNLEDGNYYVRLNGSWVEMPSSGGASKEIQDWLVTALTTKPVIIYTDINVEVNTAGEITPIILSGTLPINDWVVTTGSLPPEFTLNAETGVISYTTSAITGSGSFGITASNPAESGDEVTVNWEISLANGMVQFTNSEIPYPFMRVSTSNSNDNQFLVRSLTFAGRPTSVSNGALVADPAYPVYQADNGDGTYNYLVNVTGYGYWVLYLNRTTTPSELVDGFVSDLITGAGTYDLVAPDSGNVVLDGVNYPSDRSDIHWGAGLQYLNIPADSSLNGFLQDNNTFSFGFKLIDPWLDDGMGRGLFNRDGRNWMAVAIGHSGTYSEMLYGNGGSRSYDSSEVTTLPAGGFPAGTYIRITFDGSILEFYADGVKYYDYSMGYYWDGVEADALDVQFSNGPTANQNLASDATEYTKWQGRIERLWIANGYEVAVDDDGSTYPTDTTHAWDMNETDGSTFAPSIGSLTMQGVTP